MATGPNNMRCLHNYREIRDPAWIATGVMSAWSQHVDTSNDGYDQTVIPTACVEIVWRDDHAPVATGPTTRFRRGTMHAGLRLAGARLLPTHATAILGVEPSVLAGIEVPLTDLVGSGPHEEPLGSRTGPQAARWAGSVVTTLGCGEPEPRIEAAVGWLAVEPRRSIGELASELGVSPRQLHRRFRAVAGVAPKTFQRIVRLHHFIAASHAHRGADLATLALRSGYADQPHLTREAVSLAGATPTELRRDSYSALAASDFFKTSRGRSSIMS